MAEAATTTTVRVRPATRADMPRIHAMIHELATYEGVPDGPQLSVQDLIEDGFESSPPWFFALVAEEAGAGAGAGEGAEMVGYAICNRAYSSWTRHALYIEDLYVQPARRRGGVGAKLMQHICQLAVSLGATRVDWHVLNGNAPALRFYARCGARDLRTSEDRAALRLDAPRIAAVARGELLPTPDTA